MLFDGRTDLAVELDILLQRRRIGVGISGFGEILRDRGKGADERRDRLVKRYPQRLGLVQRIRVGGVAAEVVQELLHLARQRHRLAQVAQRFTGPVELLPAFLKPVLEVDVVVATVSLVGIQFVGTVDRDRLLDLRVTAS